MSQTTVIPHSQQHYVTRYYPSEADLDATIANAVEAQRKWKQVPLEDRIAIGVKFIEEFKAMDQTVPLELTMQMGRPISQSPEEIRGLAERANYMLSIAPSALANVDLKDTDKPGFRRFIKRDPLGVVLVIAPWNFPYLTTINSVLPALIAGNAVLLKPSPQTPLTAESFTLAFERAGLPPHLLTTLHLSPKLTSRVIKDKRVSFVSFTGSVRVGKEVERAAAEGSHAGVFKGVGLELGGKDAAYVRPDADFDYTVAELVDGAFFNSGQSCCAIERIYVHETLYEKFVPAYVDIVKKYKLGDPTLPTTNLGPVVSIQSAERIRKQVADAIQAGAKPLVPEELFEAARPGTAFVAPQVLVDVNHSMEVMKEETFGPVVGIMKVSSDQEALALMNDSPYGLTASVWTASEEAFGTLSDDLEVGTVFMNRCDYLDPALPWVGVKESGRGVSLSKFGYDQLTRPKSVHMKIVTK